MVTEEFEKIMITWQVIYRELVVWKTIQKRNPKKLEHLKIKLSMLMDEINHFTKTVAFPKEEIDKILEIKDECKRYLKLMAAA